MTENDKLQSYNKGFQAGQDHQKSSPETIKLISIMQNQLDAIKEKLDNVPTRQEVELSNERLLKEALTCVEAKFVSVERFKPIEKIVYGLAGAGLLGLAYAIFALVIKQ